jgi:hypothetical protein
VRRVLRFLGCVGAVAAGYAFVFGLLVAIHRWPWPTAMAILTLGFVAVGRWRP